MIISELEKVIISKTVSDYKNFDKVTITMRDIKFVIDYEGKQVPSYILQSIYYDKDNNIINKETKLNHLIYDDIKILISEISKKQKINFGTFTIYPNGQYESEFIWDEEADRQYRFTSVWQAIHYLGHDFFHDYLQSDFPEWSFALVVICIGTSIQTTLSIDTRIEKKETAMDLPYEIQEGLQRMHHQTNEGDFKGMIEPWNTLELRIDKLKGFDFDQDVSFRLR
jgi:hypothetical protein